MRRLSPIFLMLVTLLLGLAPAARAQSASPSSGPVRGPAEDVLAELERIRPGGFRFTGQRSERVHDAIDSLHRRREALAARIATWLRDHRQIQTDLTNAHLRLDGARTQLRAAQTTFREDSRSLYMTGAWQPMMAAISAGDLEDLGRADVYMEAVLGTELDAVKRFRTAERRHAGTFRVVEERSRGLLDLKRQIETETKRVLALGTRINTLITEVVQTFGTGSRSIASLIERAQAGQSPAPPGARTLALPVNGRTTSEFGMRTHPIYGRRSMHTGVDLSAPEGSPVRAPAGGVVLASGMAGPFGLATIIDHGSRVATVIAHQSRTAVRPGQRVEEGETIGAVGCTGWCTGPHVHLEVWFQGAPVDPLPWLGRAA